MTSETSPTSVSSESPAAAPAVRRRTHNQPGITFRRTSMRRAIVEGAAIFLTGRLLAMVPLAFWAPAVYPWVLVVHLVLNFSPPIWAALRVRSTRREKMSRRFWRLGPLLAAVCVGVDTVVALALGDASLLGGPVSRPDALRLIQMAHDHLALGGFLLAEVETALTLAIYFTIAVVCTRLANGGFLRFTMPAGNGRVTL